MMMEGGGRHVEDLRENEDDHAPRTLVGLKKMPSSSMFGDWLVRAGAQGDVGVKGAVNEGAARTILTSLAASVEKFAIFVELRRCMVELLPT
jgi:hypothetical protein